MTIVLTNDEIEDNYDISKCITAIEHMYRELGNERAITDSREDILTPVSDASSDNQYPVYHLLKSMAGAIQELGVAAIRINSNLLTWNTRDGSLEREKEEPESGRHTGFILLFDIETSEILAVFPDGIIQSYRVAGTSVLASKHLSRGQMTEVGVLGAGFQARAHVLAFDEVHNLDSIFVYSPSPASRREFCDDLSQSTRTDVVPLDSPEAVFERSETVQCATNSLDPVFERKWLEPGMHIGIINDDEAPRSFFEFDWFDCFCQSWEEVEAIEEIGLDLTSRSIPSKNIEYYVMGDHDRIPEFDGERWGQSHDWSEVTGLAGVVSSGESGRHNSEDITAFYNRGFGLQFACVGKSVYDVAVERNIGETIPTEIFTQGIQGV